MKKDNKTDTFAVIINCNFFDTHKDMHTVMATL